MKNFDYEKFFSGILGNYLSVPGHADLGGENVRVSGATAVYLQMIQNGDPPPVAFDSALTVLQDGYTKDTDIMY